jgi:hypothetical protein
MAFPKDDYHQTKNKRPLRHPSTPTPTPPSATKTQCPMLMSFQSFKCQFAKKLLPFKRLIGIIEKCIPGILLILKIFTNNRQFFTVFYLKMVQKVWKFHANCL